MICPQCHAEYRDGFTQCADCNVPLVADDNTSPTPSSAPSLHHVPEPGDPNADPFCAFWKGDDPRLHLELCSVLDEVGIPHRTVRRRDHLFNLANYPAFELGVPFSLFESAGKAVRDAFGLGADNDAIPLPTAPALLPDRRQYVQKLPESLSPIDSESLPGPPVAGEDSPFAAEDATSQIWFGEDSSVRDSIIAALHENGIYCRTERLPKGLALLVTPERAARASEIVREILESAPPE
jgi:hypothetical protein